MPESFLQNQKKGIAGFFEGLKEKKALKEYEKYNQLSQRQKREYDRHQERIRSSEKMVPGGNFTQQLFDPRNEGGLLLKWS